MRSESYLRLWLPGVILALGAAGLLAARRQVEMPLVKPLQETLPSTVLGLSSDDREVGLEERKISGVSDYAFRVFGTDTDSIRLSVYVGYYEAQSQGKTIHSPKNCLPGAGWDPIAHERITLESSGYRFPVNRYLLSNKQNQALVYYWYQGRGRVSASEYLVKWEQIRDRALAGRSDEALVRILVPLTPGLSVAEADSIATRVGAAIVRPIFASLPPFPSRDPLAVRAGS
ncbi:MAG TPA: EpsI family protein [Gemmatimonadales bacterium]|nr:EpsI family protein [Gemmatimonadales bacterium]